MSRRIVAGFDREGTLLAAVSGARARGWPVEDVYTPYPVHGIDEAMGIRPTRLGIACFLLGLAGAVLAMAFQYWTHGTDWPLNVGGRPFNAWPAYVPVAFEVVILMAGLGTVALFLLRARLLPGRRAESPDPRATDDRFVVVVEAKGAAVDVAAVLEHFRAHGAVSAEEVEPAPRTPRTWAPRFAVPALAALLALVVVAAVAVRTDVRLPNDPVLDEMSVPVSYPSYSAHPDLPGGMAMQPPRPGTVARGRLPLRFGNSPEEAERAGRELQPPFKPGDPAVLERGARVYGAFCAACHGPEGKGDGPVTKRGVPPPPSLLDGKSLQMAPGRLFHIATYGQGNMPPHEAQVSPRDRWAAVMHVLKMQKR